MNKKIFLTMFAISMAAVTISALSVGNAFAGETEKPDDFKIDYQSFMSQTEFSVVAGNSISFDAELFADQSKDLSLKTGFASENRIGYSIVTGESGLPEGITVSLDKEQINLTDNGLDGKVVRDNVGIELNIAKDTKSGTYDLVYFVYEDVREGVALVSAENITIEVIPLS